MTKEHIKTLMQLAAVLSIGGLLVGFNYTHVRQTSATEEATAKSIVADCGKAGEKHAECYETEVPSLYPKMSVPQIFDVVRNIRALDPTYRFCHVLAHKVGTRVVTEDPSKWMQALSLNPTDGMCSNGFTHGVIVGRFSSEVLTDATIAAYMPDFKKACEPRSDWRPSQLDQSICYHGMGHLFDFITNANLPKALSLCTTVANAPTGDFSRICIEGVFMQIYQPLEPDDYALIAQMPEKPTKNTVRAFCAKYTDPRYQGACLSESWPFFQNEILTGTGASPFCVGMPNDAETENCFNTASTIIGRILLGSPEKQVAACNNFPTKWQQTCYSYSAEAALEEDRNDASAAVALCKAGEPVIGQTCIQDLVNHAHFMFGSNREQLHNFCTLVPASLQSPCESGKIY